MIYIKKNIFKIILLASLFFVLFVPILSLASDGNGDLGGVNQIENPITATTVNGLIKTILEGVIKIGMPIIALALVYCGFLFVSARGNPESIKKAKDALLYTLIGAAILLGSWAIALLISDTVLAL